MRYLSDIKKLLLFMLNSPSHHVLVVSGPPGWGKTASTRKILGELGVEYQLLGAYSTPLALFNKLASFIDDNGVARGLFLLDDTHGVLTNPQSLSLLNAASWPSADQGQLRRVLWTSTTEKAAVPEFVFEGKLLILTNYMSSLPQAKAFVNRALNYSIEIKAENLSDLFIEAARDQTLFSDQAMARSAAKFVAEQARNYEAGKISLRDLSRAYDMATHFRDDCEWQHLFLKTLPQRGPGDSSPEDVVFELSQSVKRVGEQLKLFQARTGLGERKFYYLRQQLGLQSEVRSQAAQRVSLQRSKKAPLRVVKPRATQIGKGH